MDGSLRDLVSSLDGVRDIANDMDAHAADAIAQPAVRARYEVVRGLCVVVISGYFESFLKNVARSAMEDINQRSIPFGNLPAKMRAAHYEKGADVLQSRSKSPGRVAWVTSPVDDVARRLGSTSSARYELLWEAYADTQSNPGTDTVKNFLERYGCSNIWPSLAYVAGISHSVMQAELDDLIAKRNECAHTGRVTVIPTTTQIRGHCDTVQRYGHAVVGVLRAHLAAAPFGIPCNAATEKQLAAVPGIGPQRAKAIVAYRIANGPFGDVSDVQNVPGVGAASLEALRRYTHV